MTPQEIFNAMMSKDTYSQWLGIEIIEVGLGSCSLKMRVRAEMVNGFEVAHGGISFGLADSAFAFASNSRGQHSVSIETSINHLAPVFINDELTAIATEDHTSRSLGLYRVEVRNQNQKMVALFKGMVFRKKDIWVMG